MRINKLVVTVVLAWFIAQLLKTIIYLVINKKLEMERMIGSGGMPSAHSATVCSLATGAGIIYGFGGFEFAISLAFAFVTMYDAVGVRREAGNHAKILNQMMKSFKHLAEDGDSMTIEETLKEFVGHTPMQVFMGAILGIGIGCLICI